MSTPHIPERLLYVVADCPIDFGDVAVLKIVSTGKFIYFAPCCGIAWREPPLSGRLDEVNALEALEAGSFALPSLDEIRREDPKVMVIRTVPLDGLEWAIPGLSVKKR